MNRYELNKLSAGMELDSLIAEKLFGYVWVWCPGKHYRVLSPVINIYNPACDDLTAPVAYSIRNFVPRYSEEPEHWWCVVKAMAQRGYTTDIQYKGRGREFEYYSEVSMAKDLFKYQAAVGPVGEAVCKAALFCLLEREVQKCASA